MLHKKCGHIYLATPDAFLSGRRCPKCHGNARKTTEQFKEEVKSMLGEEYKVLSEYKNAKEHVLVSHNLCGSEYQVTPSNLLHGKRCPKCFGYFRKTTQMFKEEVKLLINEEYTVIGEYETAKTKIRFRHNSCGNEFPMTPNQFLTGSRCPYCKVNVIATKLRKRQYEFENEVKNLVGEEFKVQGPYLGAHVKVSIFHEVCKESFMMTPTHFLSGERCPRCAGLKRKNTNDFKEEVYHLIGNEYSVLGEYINARYKICMRHENCNIEYDVTPDNFLRGCRCPVCNESKGEKRIAEVLQKMKSDYKRQFSFNNCKNKRPLPFDFAIFTEGELVCLIEYDGIHHFKPVEKFGGELNFNKRKINDKIKEDYCMENKIQLIRICYKNYYQIEDILEERFTNINNTKGVDK